MKNKNNTNGSISKFQRSIMLIIVQFEAFEIEEFKIIDVYQFNNCMLKAFKI